MTFALDGGEWSASCPCRFIPGKSTPVPSGEETGWAPETVWKLRSRENSCPCRDSNSGLPDHSPSLYRLSYSGSRIREGISKKYLTETGWVDSEWIILAEYIVQLQTLINIYGILNVSVNTTILHYTNKY
jgi:hypothetical protein